MEGRKDVYYLTTHSTNLVTVIWRRTYDKGPTQIAREETRCRHMGYTFRLPARVLLYAHPTYRIAHTTAFVKPVVEHWLEREIVQWVHHEGSIRRPIAP